MKRRQKPHAAGATPVEARLLTRKQAVRRREFCSGACADYNRSRCFYVGHSGEALAYASSRWARSWRSLRGPRFRRRIRARICRMTRSGLHAPGTSICLRSRRPSQDPAANVTSGTTMHRLVPLRPRPILFTDPAALQNAAGRLRKAYAFSTDASRTAAG